MTNTKMLEGICTLVKTLEIDQQKAISDFVRKNEDISKAIQTPETIISSLILQLKADIATEEAKKDGKNNQLKAMKNILKSAKKMQSHQEAFQYVKTIGKFQYACDGFTLAKIKPIEGLPECPEELKYIDVEKIMSQKSLSNTELEMPNKGKLNNYIKIEKALHKGEKGYKILFNFGENLPLVSAEKLLNVMNLLNGEYKGYCNGEKNCLYFTDEDENEVILMPVAKRDREGKLYSIVGDVRTEL